MITVLTSVDDNLLYFTEKKNDKAEFELTFGRPRSVKDFCESIGIPHVEIGRVFLDGKPAEQGTVIRNSCRLDVRAVRPQAEPQTPPVFILDVHLGKLAVNLRMLGFEADYANNRDDAELAAAASGDDGGPGGVLLSCDRGLLMRRNVARGMAVRSREPERQTSEVLYRFNISGLIQPFSRCFNCGALLEDAGGLNSLSGAEKNSLPQKVRQWCSRYSRCTGCGQLYWEGSHFEKMRAKIARILSLQIS